MGIKQVVVERNDVLITLEDNTTLRVCSNDGYFHLNFCHVDQLNVNQVTANTMNIEYQKPD